LISTHSDTPDHGSTLICFHRLTSPEIEEYVKKIKIEVDEDASEKG